MYWEESEGGDELLCLHQPSWGLQTRGGTTWRRLLSSFFFPFSRLFSIGGSDEWRLSFSVYQPDSVADFRKSSPGKPYARVCVCRSVMSHCVDSGLVLQSSHNLTHPPAHSYRQGAFIKRFYLWKSPVTHRANSVFNAFRAVFIENVSRTKV